MFLLKSYNINNSTQGPFWILNKLKNTLIIKNHKNKTNLYKHNVSSLWLE